MDTKDKIEIMKAYLDGKPIQYQVHKDDWKDVVGEPVWTWGVNNYRIKPTLPQTWEEYCERYKLQKEEARVTGCSMIAEVNECCNRDKNISRNILPNRQLAEAMLALCQLIQLRDCYNEGWKPDWTDGTFKYVIYTYANEIISDRNVSNNAILTFKSEELRYEFLKNFRELIEIAKPLL